jgi:predicted TIM-barrel fold metal-dependent hydrolase
VIAASCHATASSAGPLAVGIHRTDEPVVGIVRRVDELSGRNRIFLLASGRHGPRAQPGARKRSDFSGDTSEATYAPSTPPVLESLSILEERGLVLELPAVYPRHLADVPELARSFPRLTIVIDHLGKPPIGSAAMPAWAEELEAAAAYANVAAKVSGVNTALDRPDWSADDLRPCVETAVAAFGPERLLCGSDWPVTLLNGDYGRVWRETRRLLELVAPEVEEELLAGTARRLYRLDDDRERVTVAASALEGDVGAH